METDGKITWFGFFKCFKPVNQINGIVYVKTEFRFGILEVKNIWTELSLMILRRLVTKLWQNPISAGGHIGFCYCGDPSERRLWRPQKMSSVCSGLHRSVSNFMLVDKCAQYHPNCSLSSSTNRVNKLSENTVKPVHSGHRRDRAIWPLWPGGRYGKIYYLL